MNKYWKVFAEDKVAELGIITSLWDVRKAFDADEDGHVGVLFVNSKRSKR